MNVNTEQAVGLTRNCQSDRFGIPRIIYLGRVLALCFYPIAAVVLGDLVLLLVPQAREALISFSDDKFLTQSIAFEIAFVLWTVSTWYVTRLLVGRRFRPDLIGRCSTRRFAIGVAKLLPRVLALLAGMPIAIQIAWSESGWLGALLILSSALILIGLVFRRKLAAHKQQRWLAAWKQKQDEDIERFDAIAVSGWIFIGVLAFIGIALWLAIPFFMEPLARALGTPAILLLALTSWTIFGGFILTYWPKSLHLTGWSWVLAALALVFYPINENHRVTDGSSGTQTVPGALNPDNPRQTAEEAFNAWLASRSDPGAPVVLIATAGGASRAAYWTASALGKLEDELTPRGTFSRNVFMISSISGGSLGAAAFVTAVAERSHLSGGGEGCSSVRSLGTDFTGRDHLATVVGMMLFPDLIDRFLPIRWHFWDRSRGLEDVWVRDWERIQQACNHPAGPNPWSQPFLQLHFGNPQAGWLPMLALNSTALDAGRPVLQADFRLIRSDAFDLLSGQFATGGLTLAEAVHNSARFPYVSPGGQVKLWDSERHVAGEVWDRLGDGGYVEASGTLTLAELIRALLAGHLIRPENETGQCINKDGKPSCFIPLSQLKILVLDNSPSEPADWLCGKSASGTGTGTRTENKQNEPRKPKPFLPILPDLTVPLDGAFSARDGRAVTSQVDLRELVGGCKEQFAELRLPKPPKGVAEPSMNWMLNSKSRQQMDAVLDGKAGSDPSGLVADNLERIRSWFAVTPTH